MKISAAERAANYVILVLFAAFALIPVIIIITTAFGPNGPTDSGVFHPENFIDAWNVGHLGTYLRNSVMVTVLVVCVALVCAVMSGYALGTMRFPGQQVIFYVFLIGIMVPTEAIIIPLYYDLSEVGLTNTILGIALPQIAQSIAFGTYWMRTYFRTSNRSIVEAARIDGAGSHRILWGILVPVGRPAIVTFVVLVFMWTWNEFLIPLVMAPNGSLRTAPLALGLFQGQHTTDTTLLAAAAVIVALPVVVVYLFLQRHFIKGMIDGAVKD